MLFVGHLKAGLAEEDEERPQGKGSECWSGDGGKVGKGLCSSFGANRLWPGFGTTEKGVAKKLSEMIPVSKGLKSSCLLVIQNPLWHRRSDRGEHRPGGWVSSCQALVEFFSFFWLCLSARRLVVHGWHGHIDCLGVLQQAASCAQLLFRS